MRLESPGALINTEILAKAARLTPAPSKLAFTTSARQRGESSGGSPRVVFRAMKETILLWGRMRSYVPATRGNGQPQNRSIAGATLIAVTGFGIAVVAAASSKFIRRRRQ